MYTILLVDDEQSVLEGLCVGIDWAQLGISNVLTATDGLQALELIKSTHIDLLITDILMPKMDGLTLLSSAKELRPDLHCILLSAHGEFEYARNALLLGVENYLLKPVVQEELEATIERHWTIFIQIIIVIIIFSKVIFCLDGLKILLATMNCVTGHYY